MIRSRQRALYGLLMFQAFVLSEGFGQLIFTAPANFGGRTGSGLFQASGGAVTQLNTGFVEHNFPQVSRNGALIAFSSPDPVVPPLQVPPSSDIYVFERATGQTFRIVNHETLIFNPSEVNSFTPVSAAVSPDNQMLAYGVVLTRRQGTANPRATRELNIARLSDGVILANPTFGRGPVSDDFQSEFVGISWDPGGNSFVTPSYVTVTSAMGQPVQLPAIVRFGRTPGTQNWNIQAVLSTPQYLDNQFPPAARTSLYPVLSPSGNALAYFQLFWPDAIGSSQGVIARVILANADGSNARTLFTFNQGLYPAGLSWSPNGTHLTVAYADQVSSSIGFIPAADPAEAVIRQISTTNGQMTPFPGVDAGYFPSAIPSPSSGSLANARLRIVPSGNGSLRILATGLEAGETYYLQSSPTLNPQRFGPPQAFSAEALTSGIGLNLPTPTRWFRLIDPNTF